MKAERAVARELNLPTDAVREIPEASHDELAALYSRAHAMVVPELLPKATAGRCSRRRLAAAR